MRSTRRFLLACVIAVGVSSSAIGAGTYVEVDYPPSDRPGELTIGVTYTLWLPDGVAKLRGVIVHQHGCGVGACKGGETAAYDLRWQALAKKWDCALLGPSYHQAEAQNCRLWCDPRNGSHQRFLQALHDLSVKAKRPEVEQVPWCLWGHSGGGFWASLMQALEPKRIVAIWFRSGSAISAWEKGEIPKPNIPAEAHAIPMICNPGAKENNDSRFSSAWTGAIAMFKLYRPTGAPIGVAPDPKTAHECGDSRDLAIPFFDACLAMRLPDKGDDSQKLKPISMQSAWYADLLGMKASPAAEFKGDPNGAVWLPNEAFAKAWEQYVARGNVDDATPPAAPVALSVAKTDSGEVELKWDAESDLESGLNSFIILRDDVEIARVPEKPIGKFGRPLYQSLSYHDTPERPLPSMRFVDKTAKSVTSPSYRVIAVNGVGKRSAPSAPTQ